MTMDTTMELDELKQAWQTLERQLERHDAIQLRLYRDSKLDKPILVHVVTKKGKGYPPAEASEDKYHGVVKFDVVTGKQ